jgi:phospholipase C
MDRREFIKMLGLAGTSATAYAACSAYMQEALAQSDHTIDELLTANGQCDTGSLTDIEHVVFLMQENRSFDHYFGTLRGARGFGDPRPVMMRDGQPVWYQLQAGATSTPRLRRLNEYDPIACLTSRPTSLSMTQVLMEPSVACL